VTRSEASGFGRGENYDQEQPFVKAIEAIRTAATEEVPNDGSNLA
jgi:hypothetical protein